MILSNLTSAGKDGRIRRLLRALDSWWTNFGLSPSGSALGGEYSRYLRWPGEKLPSSTRGRRRDSRSDDWDLAA
jgi:hypothetical protein